MEEKGLWNVERKTGHLERIKECCQSIQGSNREGKGSSGIKSGKGCQRQQQGLL